MKFQEKIANYVLGNSTTGSFPEIALIALNQGIESDSLLILAGMSEKDNSFELEQYFKSSLKELDITLPHKFEAAKILLSNYLGKMIAHPEEAFEIMFRIDNDIYKQVDWKKELEISEKKFVGEELGLERMFTWYRELQDFEDNGTLFYYKGLPREQQKEKFKEHLIEEAKELKSQIDKESSAYRKT